MSTLNVPEHNKALMKEIFEHLRDGDGRLFYAHLAPNAKLTITGEHSWSRVFVGKDTIANDVFGRVRSRLAGRIKTNAFHFLADGDWVMVEARGDMVTKSGEPYQNHYCLLYRLEEDMIVELKEYQDSMLVDRVLGPYSQEVHA
jgi:ketosteroid isomerase-like protein